MAGLDEESVDDESTAVKRGIEEITAITADIRDGHIDSYASIVLKNPGISIGVFRVEMSKQSHEHETRRVEDRDRAPAGFLPAGGA